MENNSWKIEISAPFGGYSPGYWKNNYPSFGNKNMSGVMSNVDMLDPAKITQGPDLATLTAGDQVDAMTTLIKHICDIPASSDLTYAIGGAKLYKISSTAVTNDGTFPHTINKAVVTGEAGESVQQYGGKTYYIYNYTGGGDIGMYNGTTFDDDWGSTVPTVGTNSITIFADAGSGKVAVTSVSHGLRDGDVIIISGTTHYNGEFTISNTTTDTFAITTTWVSNDATGTIRATLRNAPHPSVVGNDDILYFGNGPYVGWYDHLTNSLVVDDLDLQIGAEVVDVRYDNNRVVVAVNYPNLTGSNNSWGTICYWDGVSGSWDDQYPNPRIRGKIGAIYVKQGTVFVWYQNVGDSGYCFGYIYGNSIKKIRGYSGSLPNFGQVGEYNETIMWVSGGMIYCYGAVDELMTPVMFQLAPGGYTTVGALASPFGTPLVASNQTTSYKLAKFSGYSLGYWKSLLFDCDSSLIDEVVVYYEPTATGSRCDVKIESNRGAATLTLQKAGETGTITHGNDSGQSKKSFQPGVECNNFRIYLDWSAGSATNPQGIRSVKIYGHVLEKVS